MFHELVFTLNLDLEISSHLGRVIIIIYFYIYLKALNSFSLMNYTQALLINL